MNGSVTASLAVSGSCFEKKKKRVCCSVDVWHRNKGHSHTTPPFFIAAAQRKVTPEASDGGRYDCQLSITRFQCISVNIDTITSKSTSRSTYGQLGITELLQAKHE